MTPTSDDLSRVLHKAYEVSLIHQTRDPIGFQAEYIKGYFERRAAMADQPMDMTTLTISQLIDKLTLIYETYGDLEVFGQGGVRNEILPFRGAGVVKNSDPMYVILNRPKQV